MVDETEHGDDETGGGNATARERSTIQFPYTDLEDAIRIAKGIYEIGGSSCARDQLAARLQMAVRGGAFLTRVNAAKIYGVLETTVGGLKLTDLGSRICDPRLQKEARVAAFLNVPLYDRIYQNFRGKMLPPASGLEATMVEFGVSRKQAQKARQAFSRSAEQAGFFEYGPDRLVEPANKTPDRPDEEDPERGEVQENTDKPKRHSLVDGLIETLPEAGKEWSLEDRRKWLQAAGNIFELIFTSKDEGSLVVDLKRKGDATKAPPGKEVRDDNPHREVEHGSQNYR